MAGKNTTASGPDAAKNQYEADTKKKTKAEEKKEAERQRHLSDLKKFFGDVGMDNGQYRIGDDAYGNLILQKQVLDEKGKPTGEWVENFFWVENDGVFFQTYTRSQIIKKIKQSFGKNYETLRKLMYDKGYISKNEFNTKDENALNDAVGKAARNFSTVQVQKYTINGETKFQPFAAWAKDIIKGTDDDKEKNLPVRDINLQDRDVIRTLVENIYMEETGNAPDTEYLKQKTDFYMDMIKKGTLTTGKEAKGEFVRTSTPGFSEARVKAELQASIPKEQPTDYQKAQSLNFLSFLAQLG